MSTAEHDHRARPGGAKGLIRAARRRLEATRLSLDRVEKAIADSLRFIEQSRTVLAASLDAHLRRAGSPGPAQQAIITRESTPFVSEPGLAVAEEDLWRAEIDYGRALLGSSRVWDKLAASLTDDILREEQVAMAIYDRAAARLREHEAR